MKIVINGSNVIKSFILTIAIFSSQFANSQQFKWNPETKKFEKTNKKDIQKEKEKQNDKIEEKIKDCNTFNGLLLGWLNNYAGK